MSDDRTPPETGTTVAIATTATASVRTDQPQIDQAHPDLLVEGGSYVVRAGDFVRHDDVAEPEGGAEDGQA